MKMKAKQVILVTVGVIAAIIAILVTLEISNEY
jgi:hypothetical protein